MAIVTDPDDLDRWQVAVDPFGERISIRGHGAIRSDKSTTGGTFTGIDPSKFTDNSADFVTSGVLAGDILTIVSSGSIGHYVVSGVISSVELNIDPYEGTGFAETASGVTYRINDDAPVLDGGSGGNVGEGATEQAIYSFLKEEWQTFDTNLFALGEAPDLIQFTFPLESITREQFEIGGTSHGDWDWKDDTTRNLIRTGGWAQINSSGTTKTRYTGIITLGSIDADGQVYYLQQAAGTPTNFVLTGAVNQAIKVFDDDAAEDFRTFLKLFVRKKARSYAQSEIADIGVTTIETLVNRFPLAHGNDAAITKLDGELKDETPFQTVSTVDTGTDGSVADADTSDGLFEFTSAGSTFIADGLTPGDVVEITAGNDIGTYEIQAVSLETALVLFQEPGTAIVGGGSQSFTTKTRVRSAEQTDGVTADVDTVTGTLSSATANFVTDAVVANDIVVITAGTGANLGAYKVVSRDTANQLTLDTTDQPLAGGSGHTFTVYQPGMFLQFFSTDATQVSGTSITFADANPDTISRAGGDFVADGFVHGMAVTIAGSTNNNSTVIVDTVATTLLTLIASEALTAGTDASGVTIDGNVGVVRTLNNVDYPFNWRLFGNGGTLGQCFQFIQRELRRATDIDLGNTTARGDITDLLMSFASPTGTGINLYIDDLASADLNNATFQDISGDNRNFAFIAGVTINLNTNLTSDTAAKVVVFFTDPTGNPNDAFGEIGAIVVQDVDSNEMSASTPLVSPLSFTFDYDNNAQGGRTPATDANVTIVAIGKETAQYIQVTGTIQRQNDNIFSLVSSLERNYSNP